MFSTFLQKDMKRVCGPQTMFFVNYKTMTMNSVLMMMNGTASFFAPGMDAIHPQLGLRTQTHAL